MNIQFWKYFAMGIVGILLHITQKVMNKTNDHPNTFTEYWQVRKAEIMYAVLSYIIIVTLWNSGELFQIPTMLPFLNLQPIDPIPLSYWTALIGYFSSSIMGFILYTATAASEVFKKRFGIKTDKVASDESQPNEQTKE